ARDPNGNNVDFPADYNVVIPANGTYKYTKSRIFNSPGRHDLFIANYNNGKWDLNFPEGTSGGAVRSRDTYVVSNPILTNPIVLWSTPTVGNPVTASFKIKNASNSPLNIGTIVIAARDPNGNNVDFPADYNVVIPANGTYTHVVTRAFNSAGEHKLFIANYNNGKWDLNFPEAITYGIERIRTTFVSN
ncbi:hypothetical protein KC992_02680, partial [Candidatus Saccharibacteria bacterium]|nr:hypothetical protein [Candidatus Saccharibacteria bacterium]